jgi:hypothetical protein
MATDVLDVKQRAERVASALSDLKMDFCEHKGKVGWIENWREAAEPLLSDLRREVREVREVLRREVVSVSELRKKLSVEVEELTKGVGMLGFAKGKLEARRQFEVEQNYRRFCELCYGIHGCEKSFGLGVRFLELAACLDHSDAQRQYSRCHCEGILL